MGSTSVSGEPNPISGESKPISGKEIYTYILKYYPVNIRGLHRLDLILKYNIEGHDQL
jgi:hypothetical protein